MKCTKCGKEVEILQQGMYCDGCTEKCNIDLSQNKISKHRKKKIQKDKIHAAIIVIAAILLCIYISLNESGKLSIHKNVSEGDSDKNTMETAAAEETATPEENKEEIALTEILASYNGSTKSGTVLDEENGGIAVIAKYDDGTIKEVYAYQIKEEATLEAGKTSTILITYCGKEYSLTVKCTDTETSKPKVTKKPVKTSKPKATKKPVKKKNSTKSQIKSEIRWAAASEFGSSNVIEINYVKNLNFALIKVKGKENITNKLTVKQMYLGIYNVLKDINDIKDLSVDFNITYPLVDVYGNKDEQIVIKASYKKKTRQQLNFTNLSFLKIDGAADEWWMHPALQQALYD